MAENLTLHIRLWSSKGSAWTHPKTLIKIIFIRIINVERAIKNIWKRTKWQTALNSLEMWNERGIYFNRSISFVILILVKELAAILANDDVCSYVMIAMLSLNMSCFHVWFAFSFYNVHSSSFFLFFLTMSQFFSKIYDLFLLFTREVIVTISHMPSIFIFNAMIIMII